MPKVEVHPGETYTAAFTRNGDGWSLFTVKAEKGRKEIPVFTDGSVELHEGDRITVTKITGVKNGDRKDKDGNWKESWSVNAEVTVNGSAFKEEQAQEELPF